MTERFGEQAVHQPELALPAGKRSIPGHDPTKSQPASPAEIGALHGHGSVSGPLRRFRPLN